jgi:lipid A 3-O-deacylase
MTIRFRRLLLATGLLVSLANAYGSNWIDGISLSYGHDSNDNDTNLLQAGLQNKWQRTWFNGGAWYVGGYWDAELAYMESEISGAENSELFDLSLTPVFRMQRDATLSSGVSPFAEAGIGAHVLSETRLGDRSFSTALQLGSVLGLGLGFGGNGQYEVSYRFQRLSNLGIKQPNDGMDLHLLRFAYNFSQ